MKNFENKIREYLKERGWDTLRPADLAKSIMIEGGELLELFQWENKSSEEIKSDPETLNEIRKELADVMTYCFDMAVILDIDVEQMLDEKLRVVMEKYPTHIFNKEKNEPNPGTEEEYKLVKNKYRNGEV